MGLHNGKLLSWSETVRPFFRLEKSKTLYIMLGQKPSLKRKFGKRVFKKIHRSIEQIPLRSKITLPITGARLSCLIIELNLHITGDILASVLPHLWRNGEYLSFSRLQEQGTSSSAWSVYLTGGVIPRLNRVRFYIF